MSASKKHFLTVLSSSFFGFCKRTKRAKTLCVLLATAPPVLVTTFPWKKYVFTFCSPFRLLVLRTVQSHGLMVSGFMGGRFPQRSGGENPAPNRVLRKCQGCARQGRGWPVPSSLRAWRDTMPK